jgi:predicted transcriptional regulator
MCMLTHRLQILLDEERYARVAELARQRGSSVAAVIREAIDHGLPAAPRRRSAAVRRLLEAPDMQLPDPDQLRDELDEIRGRGR